MWENHGLLKSLQVTVRNPPSAHLPPNIGHTNPKGRCSQWQYHTEVQFHSAWCISPSGCTQDNDIHFNQLCTAGRKTGGSLCLLQPPRHVENGDLIKSHNFSRNGNNNSSRLIVFQSRKHERSQKYVNDQ